MCVPKRGGWDALNLGVEPNAPVIRDLIRHEQTGLLVDPKRGIIYGAAGTPVGAVCSDGYVRLGGNRNGYLYAHRVIYEAVHREIPPGLEIDHLNGRKADNRARNLEAVTKSQNVQRAVAMGLAPAGEQKAEAKLTEELVREIRRTAGTVTNAEWARRLGVDKTTIRHARIGKTWRHVPCRGRSRTGPPTSHGKRPRRGKPKS
jgi:hypothetical protein